MAEKEQAFIFDGLGSFDGGVNSGLAPQLLENNQLAFATNASLRGGFVHNRPGNRRQTLGYGTSPQTQPLVEQSMFQGAAYYKPDSGPECFFAAIGGRLFQFTPDNDRTVSIIDQTIPSDPNPAGPQLAWMWQAENNLIWQDGQSVPVFWTGASARRSDTEQEVLGQLSVNFVVPEIGETVVITLSAPYAGQTNQVFFIDGSTFQATTPAATNNVKFTSLYDVAGTIYPVGTNVIIDPNVFGVQAVPYNIGGSPGTWAPNTLDLILHLSQPTTFAVGTKMIVIGKVFKLISSGGNFVLVRNQQTVTINPGDNIPAGTIYYLSGTSFPTTIIGTLNAAFTAPIVGGTQDTILNPAYTGAAGQIVFIGGGQYTIEALPGPPPGVSLTIININGNPGDTINAPQDLLSVPELPIGRMGTYGMGRVWQALTDGFSFMAGDIVGGPSGTFANNFRDSVLKTTENTYLAGGGTFRVPSAGGQITAMRFTANLDTSLGQGPLQVFTPYDVFSVNSPVERAAWQVITNPILTQSLIGNGGVGQNSTQLVNGDILFRSLDANIRSLILARRDFDTWGNTPISREMERVIRQENTALLPFSSASFFDNRFLMTSVPTASALGTFHSGLIALNLDPISSLKGKAPSIYDGLWTGLNVLQVVTGQFSGVQRTFAFCADAFTNRIQIWEVLHEGDGNNFDNDTAPITWSFETSALFQKSKGKGYFDPIELIDGEIYLSDIIGAVNVQVWYRPEYSPCWTPWIEFGLCANNANTGRPIQYRTRVGLGSPSSSDCDPTNNRPYRIGANFQFRFQFTGACKFVGGLFKANRFTQPFFSIPVCKPLCDTVDSSVDCEPCRNQGNCLEFPLVFYNLNANKTYINGALSFNIQCGDGTEKPVTIPAGTITLTLPFPPGFSGVYPPLILNCGGGLIVRNIPSGATQEEIDAIANEMITVCAERTAQAIANCPNPEITNEAVFFDMNCTEGNIIQFSGALPGWITLDVDNSRLVGAAGTFTGETQSIANAAAQFQLNTFAAAQITAGNLFCGPPTSYIFIPSDAVPSLGFVDCTSATCGPSGFFYFFHGADFFKTADGITVVSVGTSDINGRTSNYGGGLFVITDSGLIQTSPDGVTWTTRSAASIEQMRAGVYANGQFTLVGLNGSTQSSPDGINWTSNPTGGAEGMRCVTYASGLALYVAAGENGAIYTSPDAITWTARTSGIGTVIGGIATNGTMLVATATFEPAILTSSDGINWTVHTDPTDGVAGVSFGSGVWAIGDSGTGSIWAGTDGINYTLQRTSSFPASIFAMVFCGTGTHAALQVGIS